MTVRPSVCLSVSPMRRHYELSTTTRVFLLFATTRRHTLADSIRSVLAILQKFSSCCQLTCKRDKFQSQSSFTRNRFSSSHSGCWRWAACVVIHSVTFSRQSIDKCYTFKHAHMQLLFGHKRGVTISRCGGNTLIKCKKKKNC